MNLLDTLNQDLKNAMRAGDDIRKRTLRTLKTAITRAEKDKGHALSDDEILAVIRRQAKQRRDSIEAFQKGGRQDLVDAEQAELEILESYLPAQMSEADIRAAAKQVIAELGATSMRDMGKVMGKLMAQLKNQADGRVINQIVRELLREQ
ncbi:MAG: GatB/YqeY domain-containing protein [Chloroflexi bacterium]|nr:GatB/YqeY domain-containing protein [Chloroflexota bacterium]